MKQNKLLTSIVLVVFLASFLLLTSCDRSPEAIRINNRSEAPSELWQALEEIEMKSGVYFFSGHFLNDNHLYFAICGDEKSKNNFDVEISNLEYEPKNIENDKVIDGIYHIDIEEGSSNVPDYSSDLEHPFNLFKIKMKSSYDELIVTSKGEKLPINYWWGADTAQGEADNFSYEVVQNKEDIPVNIWSEIELLDLERGLIDFEQRDYGADAYFALLCGGEEYQRGYQVTFEKYHAYEESPNTPNQSKDVAGEIVFTVHEYQDQGMLDYAKGFKYPFVVIKVQGKDDKAYTLMGGINHSINTYNSKFEVDILWTNREMKP